MTADIQATLDQLNAQYRASGTTWGYDDAKGAYYSMEANGTRRYQAGTGMPGDRTQKPAGGGGLVHGPMVWDQKTGRWVSKLDANKILGLGVMGTLGAGALDAAGVFGGGAAASAGAPAAGGSVAGDVAAVDAALAPAIGGAVAPALGTIAPDVVAGTGIGKALTGATGLAGILQKAGPALASLIPMLAGTNGSGNLSNPSDLLKQNPQLASLLDMSVQRAQRTDPLHQAITQLAMSRLPTNMQR